MEPADAAWHRGHAGPEPRSPCSTERRRADTLSIRHCPDRGRHSSCWASVRRKCSQPLAGRNPTIAFLQGKIAILPREVHIDAARLRKPHCDHPPGTQARCPLCNGAFSGVPFIGGEGRPRRQPTEAQRPRPAASGEAPRPHSTGDRRTNWIWFDPSNTGRPEPTHAFSHTVTVSRSDCRIHPDSFPVAVQDCSLA